MKRAALIFLAAVMILAMGAAQAMAGIVVYSTGDMGGDTTTYYQDNMIRQNMDDVVVITDLNKGLITFINPKAKTYWQGTPKELTDSTKGAVDKAMEDAMKGMPEAQREAMKKMMAQQKKKTQTYNPKLTVKKTGKTAKVAGYDTEMYQVIADGKPMLEMWVAPDLDLSDEIDLGKMGTLMSAHNPAGGNNPMASKEVMELFKKGYPLKQSAQMGRMGGITTTATKVEEKDVNDDMFKIPSGYKRVKDMASMM